MMLNLLLILGGCAVHGHGVVVAADPPMMRLSEGQEYTLRVDEGVRELTQITDVVVEYWGRKRGRVLTVDDYKVGEGPHGMPTWIGTLTASGARLGLQDRNSGLFYVISEEDVDQIEDLVGETLLIEGYVDGPHEIRLMFITVLDLDEEPPPGSSPR